MTTLREAAQQALEALMDDQDRMVEVAGGHYEYKTDLAIGALKAALAQQAEPCPNCASLEAQNTELDRKLAELEQAESVQEPVAWLQPKTVDAQSRPDLGYETCSKADYGAFPVYTALAQEQAEPTGKQDLQVEPAQKPAYKVKVTGRWHDTEPLAAAFSLPDGEHYLYATPPQRLPLTEEEIYEMYNEPRSDAEMVDFARAVERAHGIGEAK